MNLVIRTGRTLSFATALLPLLIQPASADLGRLTVDEAVRMALKDNSTIYAAMKQVEISEGAYKQTRSSILPQVNATGDLSHSYQGAQNTGSNSVAGRTNGRTGSLSIGQSLINLQAWNNVRQANHNLEATRHGEADTRLTVALAVKQQFYSLVRAKQIAVVQTDAVRRDSSTLALTQGLFEVGTAPRTDLLKARTTAAQSQLTLITAAHTVDIERLRLASLLGLQSDQGLDVDTTLAADAALPDSTTLLARAYQDRPDLLQLAEQSEAAGAGLASAQASRYPSLAASFGIQKSISTFTQDSSTVQERTLKELKLITSPDTGFIPIYTTGSVFLPETSIVNRPYGWSIAARLNIPIFDGFLAKGRIQQNAAQQDIARRDYQQRKTDVALLVRQAWLSLQEARQKTGVAADALAFASENFELTKEKYRLGSSTLLDLTTAEAQLTQSRSDVVDAAVGLQLARAQLDRAVGMNP